MTAVNFATVMKDMTTSSVHVPTALGNAKRGRAKSFKACIGETAVVAKRELKPHDADTAKTPFLYDVNALGSLRPDQVPRFFGSLTNSETLPKTTVKLDELHAMQDRVDPKKVEAMRTNGIKGNKFPVVVRHNNKNYIADGHHRLAAQWLDGQTTAEVRFNDLEPVSTALKRYSIAKVDESLGLVFGWAVVCKVNGEDYFDLNVDYQGEHAGERVPEHIPEDAMLKAAADFMENSRAGNEMHNDPDVGTYIFAFPLTTEIAKAMDIQTNKTGLMIAYKPPPAVLAKFRSGEYTGFSIQGKRLEGCKEIEA